MRRASKREYQRAVSRLDRGKAESLRVLEQARAEREQRDRPTAKDAVLAAYDRLYDSAGPSPAVSPPSSSTEDAGGPANSLGEVWRPSDAYVTRPAQVIRPGAVKP